MNMEEKENYKPNFDLRSCDHASKYEIISIIGKGLFGEIFKAGDKGNNRFVAMKKASMKNEKGDIHVTALREIRILQELTKINHPNVVKLIEVCSTKETHSQVKLWPPYFYLILEFCEHDLAGLLFNVNVKFSLGEIKKVMEQLFNGLYFIHLRKILHRDVKPANILITKNGVLKLADFGLARPFTVQNCRFVDFNVTNSYYWYQSPELLLGDKNFGSPVDLWSAGCILAEMWTRSPIIQGGSEQQQLILISELCGSITPAVWSKVKDLDLFNIIELPQNEKRKVEDKLKPYIKDPYACDLLDKLLQLDPGERIDSEGAMNHDFFWTDPMPCDLSNMLAQHTESMFEYLIHPTLAGHMLRAHQEPGTSQSSAAPEDAEFTDIIF